MSKESKEIYEFGPFRLDVSEHVFGRTDGLKNVSLPEKAFQTLVVLVRNPGSLVTKSELLEAVWPDSFVEENNLDKAIHAIRQVLGVGPDGEKYVETVRKHGYRFVGDVRRINDGGEPVTLSNAEADTARGRALIAPAPQSREADAGFRVVPFQNGEQPTELSEPEISTAQTQSGAFIISAKWRPVETRRDQQGRRDRSIAVAPSVPVSPDTAASLPAPRTKRSPRWALGASAAAFLVLIGGLGVTAWYQGWRTTEAPVISTSFNAERLSTDGKVFLASLSPNGKFVVFSSGYPGERQSLWLRNLETGHNAEIISESDEVYDGLEFSPDGDWLYFARRPISRSHGTDIYRISIPGGIPQPVVSDTQGWMSISPDGRQIAFLRWQREGDGSCSLFVADAVDGGNERKLVTRPRPEMIHGIDFSPDGGQIAFASGQSQNAGTDYTLSAVDLGSGEVYALSPERFFNIRGVVWLPDRRSALIAASRISGQASRVWRISIDTGKAELVTKDADSYLTLSMDRAGTTIVATKSEEAFSIRVLDLLNGDEKLVVPKGTMMEFGRDGKLYYASVVSGNSEIWCIDADGKGKRQLTNDPGNDLKPVIGSDDKTVYFASSRSGSAHVWRMNADGTGQTQITSQTGGFPLAVSPDGEWVFYDHGLDRSLWRVSTRTGEEQMVLDRYAFAISPDGTRAAFPENVGGVSYISIVSLENGQTVDQLKVVDQERKVFKIVWPSQGNSIAYVLIANLYRGNSVWLHPLDKRDTPKKLAEISERISEGGSGVAFSRDGRLLAISQGDWLHDAVLLRALK